MGGMFHHRSTNVVTQAPLPKIIAATFSAAFDAMALVTWLYVLSVTFVELCPRRSATTFGCSPALSARVAHVWRRSWRRSRGSGADGCSRLQVACFRSNSREN